MNPTSVVGDGDRRAFREHGVVALRGVLPLDIVRSLEAPVARRYPVIRQVVRTLVAGGADYAAMSGSGSAVFGVFAKAELAQNVHGVLVRRGWQAWATHTLSRRAVVRELRQVLAGS